MGAQDPIVTLKDEYSGDDIYERKVKDLSSKYKYIRRTRPDGNCFFRAFCYAYLERLLRTKTEFKDFLNRMRNSHHNLIQLGFPQFTVEDFYDTVSGFIFFGLGWEHLKVMTLGMTFEGAVEGLSCNRGC